MATTTAPAEQPGWQGRWGRLRITATALLATGVCVTGAWTAYADHYQPLRPGDDARPLSGSVRTIGDGAGHRFAVDATRAPEKTLVAYAVRNTGRSAVRLDGLAASKFPPAELSWAPAGADVEPAEIGGPRDVTHAFPVTLEPGRQVVLVLTIGAPLCPTIRSYFPVIAELPLRWSARGAHHVYRLPLRPGSTQPPLLRCPSAGELAGATG